MSGIGRDTVIAAIAELLVADQMPHIDVIKKGENDFVKLAASASTKNT
jgi:hypothetical protein